MIYSVWNTQKSHFLLWYVCVCVCVCVCACAHICVHACMDVYITHIYICVCCLCCYTHLFMHVCLYTLHTHTMCVLFVHTFYPFHTLTVAHTWYMHPHVCRGIFFILIFLGMCRGPTKRSRWSGSWGGVWMGGSGGGGDCFTVMAVNSQ